MRHTWGVSLPGFENAYVAVGEVRYFVASSGAGPAVLLLHGFPQTHVCWRHLAPMLSGAHTVVVPDLRGYGASRAPAGGPRGEGYSKREMAAEFIEIMAGLGHERFAVVGHDRGARVAYRLALDHPQRVTHVALLNIVPTIDQFERMGEVPRSGTGPGLSRPAGTVSRTPDRRQPVWVSGPHLRGWASRPDGHRSGQP